VSLLQYIFDQSTAGRSFRNRFFNRLRKTILRYQDPVVHYNIRNRRIAMRLSHELPLIRNIFPTYADNLTRIAAFIRGSWRRLSMIDVGSNVGDSYCLVNPQPGEAFLLIEGNPHYYELLVANTANEESVVCVKALLADSPTVSTHTFLTDRGTARLVTDKSSREPTRTFTSLDSIVDAHTEFRSANLLKTDVDGFDTKVLRGAQRLIATAKPVILFEHDPALLEANSQSIHQIFSTLADLSYSEFIFYDNRGFLMGMIRVDDKSRLEDTISYARAQQDCYYDVCCFSDDHARSRDEFLAREREFYANLAQSRIASRIP
jgi:FkbM family methyltransferase